MPDDLSADVVIVGAGIVGACCAFFAARAGLRVCVIDRGPLAGGTTGAGEGNLLVSDKEPGPELDLALLSHRQWHLVGAEECAGAPIAEHIELEEKGGLVVATSDSTQRSLLELAVEQSGTGLIRVEVPADQLSEYEPNLAADLAGGVFYPQDMQLQPMMTAAVLLRAARSRAATVLLGEEVTDVLRSGSSVVGVRTTRRSVSAPAVVNAAGTWAGALATLAGVDLPVMPRRGVILVTEPLPRVVRHKVYLADYVADVASDSADLQASPVVEGTRSGTVLIGATRERVGFDRTWSDRAVSLLAVNAARLFPFLLDVAVLRAYRGFRPYCPDHLPVIGPDPRAPGLWHACGHEGAGIGLAAATGLLICESLCGTPTSMPLAPFRPERFTTQAAA